MSALTIFLLLLYFLPPFQWRTEAITDNTTRNCVRTCGALTVSYPFGFSGQCEFPLTCLTNGTMEFKGYTIRNITWETISLNFPAKCNRSITELGRFFGENYALTSQNGLLMRNCSGKTTSFNGGGCLVSPNLVEKRFGVENCHRKHNNSIVNVKCFGVNNGGGNGSSSILSYDDVAKNGCVYLLSSIVVVSDDGIGGGGDGDVSIEFKTVQVMWWVIGTCKCDPNAVCNRVGSDGFQCRCNPGFSGDGFVDGGGCHNASDSNAKIPAYAYDAVGGYKTAILVGGIVAGASSTIILAAICYLCRRRTTYMRNQVSTRRLLFEAAGNSTVPMYPYREIERATSGFSEKQRLGTGAYGTVYAGKFHNNEYVAVKKLKHQDTDSIDQVMNEIKLLSSVSHPNLVRLLGCCIENGEQILVYEYMANGTLSQHLHRERGNGLPWTVRLTIASETAQAISYLHSSMNPPIFHRDIKSSNILLDFDYRSKVADFGLSRLGLVEMSHISTAPQGTPGYVDPQYHQNFHLSDKSDVYSFGVVLVEIITAMRVVDFSRPHLEVNLAALAVDRIGKGRIDEIIDPFIEIHRDAWTLASVHKVAELAFRCLAYHRDMRPSMMEVAHELEQNRLSGWASIEENIYMGSSVASSCSSPFNGSERSLSGISAKKGLGSQRLIVQQKPMDRLASLEEGKDGSPVSVNNDGWFSEQSSPSTNSLLGNVIQ
ncbi:wall-associated receptor kinase-like 14 [Silene latifolia]|uniref:wall-associated receptor kinase-like 14 n=1 Tax=Silene latifolia TaxID=37657 RepID=UPI003D7809C1